MKEPMPKTGFHNIIRRDENPVFVETTLPKIFNYKVYKHNKLIESKSDFSAMEHRIIVIAISQISPKDENFKMYKIKIQDVLGKRPNTSHYDTVRKAVKRLHKCSIEMEDDDGWATYPFITKAQGKHRENFIEVQFHEDIQKFLLGLKSHYTCYTLDNVMKFKKNYSLRIYEFCKQYLTVHRRDMKMDYLRNLLSLEKKHLEFSNFKKNVLVPSLKEINEHSDIKVTFMENREGKSVDSIRFIIYRKQGIPLQKSRTLIENLVFGDNQEKLLSLGFDYEEMDMMRQKYMENKISAVLELFNRHIDEIKIPKAWIENALEKNFMDSSVYKRQVKARSDGIELMRAKDRESAAKRLEIRSIRTRMDTLEDDISFYKIEGKLRPGDVMRFSADCSVDDAIEILKGKLKEEESMIQKLISEVNILDAEAEALK